MAIEIHQLLAMFTVGGVDAADDLRRLVGDPGQQRVERPEQDAGEYPAVVHANAPSIPASGCRPAARNTSAASGGITIIEGSDITCPCAATNATTYGSTERGAFAKIAVIPALSSPDCSATPIASSITITLPSGGKLMKFSTKLVSHQVIPSPVSSPLTARGSSVPGMVTLTPSTSSKVEATATNASR